MVGWHHQLDGHEFKQAPRVDDGQGSLACGSPWGQKESVQFSSVAELCPTLFDSMDCSMPGISASASVLPMNIQDWFPLGWTGWISLFPKGLSRVFTNTAVQKYQFFHTQLSLQSNSHIHTWLLEKTIALTRRTFVGKVMSLLFNMLSRWFITFLPRSKCLLISWLQSPSVVILEPPQK